jgi:hypothetical protein
MLSMSSLKAGGMYMSISGVALEIAGIWPVRNCQLSSI